MQIPALQNRHHHHHNKIETLHIQSVMELETLSILLITSTRGELDESAWISFRLVRVV